MTRKTTGTKLSGWCMTDYHESCHRPLCNCDCHGRKEDK